MKSRAETYKEFDIFWTGIRSSLAIVEIEIIQEIIRRMWKSGKIPVFP